MATLKQKVQVNQQPATPGDASPGPSLMEPSTKINATLQARPDKQYISGSAMLWVTSFLRALPPWKDDLEASFGRELWEKLSFDPVIWSHIQVLRLLILSVDIILSPSIPQPAEDETDPEILADWEKQQAIVDWARDMLNSMTEPYKVHLYKALDSLYQSYVVSEKTFEEPAASNDYKRRIVEVMAKPQEVVGFVVDPFLHVIGFVGVRPTQGGFYVLPVFLSSNEQTLEGVLPREKCAVLTYYPEKEDIRGRNPIRAAYEPWWAGFGTWGQLMQATEQTGGAAVVAKCAPDAQATEREDPITQQPILDSNGNTITDYPQDAMLRAVEQLAQGVAVAIPAGAEIEPFFVAGGLESLLKVINECDKRKGLVLLGQNRAQSEAEYGSKADSTTGKDLLDQFVAWGRDRCSSYTRNEMLRDLVLYNWGEDCERFVPTVTMGGNVHEDWASLAIAAGKLLPSASPTQANWVWSEVLGGPVMTIEEMEQKRQPMPDLNDGTDPAGDADAEEDAGDETGEEDAKG